VSGIREVLARSAAILDGMGVPWCLVGGLAVSARTAPRFTRDVDVAVAVADDAGAERVVHAFTRCGWRTALVLEHGPSGRLATVRLHPPGSDDDGILVDCLFSSCGVEPEVTADAEELEILTGLSIPVARTGHLVAMKILALDDRFRPQDREDVRALLAVSDPRERDRTAAALTLIERRGFHRGRDLEAAWRRWMEEESLPAGR